MPLQSRSGPEGSRKLRFPDYLTTAQDVGKVVSLTHRPPLPPRNSSHNAFPNFLRGKPRTNGLQKTELHDINHNNLCYGVNSSSR